MAESTPTPEQNRALDIARDLIRAGVPVFAAEPGEKPGTYRLPKHWEKTYPSEVNLEKWQPGWALAAVGGHVADFLDVDPRNGGDASAAELRSAGQWPKSFGTQETPSGGTHDLISATGERKATNFMPGLDLQSGDPQGVGRGFVWIAPTVRASKDPKDNKKLRPYRWVREPDLTQLAEYAPGADTSTEGIVSRVHAKRASRATAPPERPQVDQDDPFLTASETFASAARNFTQAEAEAFVRPYLLDLRAAKIGSIEEQTNRAATVLFHFVPEFWTPDQGMALLEDALGHTAYDPNGPSDWRVDKFRSLLMGSRPPRDAWKAGRKVDVVYTAPAPTPPVEESDVDRLLAKMLDRDALDTLDPPTPLIRDVLDLDSESWLIGGPGSFKSFVALDWAIHVALGLEWRGHPVTQGEVIYVAAEGKKGLPLRVKAWERLYEHRMAGVRFLPEPVQVMGNMGKDWETLVQACARVKPAMIVLDTQARITVGLDENDAGKMSFLTEAVRRLKEATGACVLVVHHTGRNGKDARGSNAVDGAQDAELRVDRPENRAKRMDLWATIRVDKAKDGNEDQSWKVQMEKVELGPDPRDGRPLTSLAVKPYNPFLEATLMAEIPEWRANLTENQEEVVAALEEHSDETGATRAQLIKWIKIRREHTEKPPLKENSVDSAVTGLVKKMVVSRVGARLALKRYLDDPDAVGNGGQG